MSASLEMVTAAVVGTCQWMAGFELESIAVEEEVATLVGLEDGARIRLVFD